MTKALGRTEFIILMGLMSALIAYTTDAMMPAFPQIGAELTPDDLNKAQLVLPVFFLGLGIGTFFMGPLSDAFGRKWVLGLSTVFFVIASLVTWQARTMETMLIARAIQGLAAAGPRVIGIAVVRDLYSGRQMAKIMSMLMIVFAIVPALAPTIGKAVMIAFDWRAIFLSMGLFVAIVIGWFLTRQYETLPRDRRIPLSMRAVGHGVKEVFQTPMFVLSLIVLTLCFAALVAVLSSTQMIYDHTFGQEHGFHIYFALTAFLAAPASFINARLVERLGMRRLISFALGAELCISAIMIVMTRFELWPDGTYFPAWFIFSTSVFFMVGLTIGNLNALAMEPFAHIAGIAASTMTAFSTVFALVFAVPIGQAFDGTPVPLAIGVFLCVAIAWLFMLKIKRLERVQG